MVRCCSRRGRSFSHHQTKMRTVISCCLAGPVWRSAIVVRVLHLDNVARTISSLLSSQQTDWALGWPAHSPDSGTTQVSINQPPCYGHKLETSRVDGCCTAYCAWTEQVEVNSPITMLVCNLMHFATLYCHTLCTTCHERGW